MDSLWVKDAGDGYWEVWDGDRTDARFASHGAACAEYQKRRRRAEDAGPANVGPMDVFDDTESMWLDEGRGEGCW